MVQELYVLMITAAVVSIIFKFLKQPVVLGYIVAGVLVGPNLFGDHLSHSIYHEGCCTMLYIPLQSRVSGLTF